MRGSRLFAVCAVGLSAAFATGCATVERRAVPAALAANAAVPGDITTDVEGNPRIRQLRVDMGAYESPYLAPTVPIPALSPLGLLLAGLALAIAGIRRLRRSG